MFWRSVERASLVGDARKEFNAARAMVWPARRRPPPPLPLCLGTYGDEAVAHGDARLPHALSGDEVASESAVAHLGDELALAAREDVNKWRTAAKTGPSKKAQSAGGAGGGWQDGKAKDWQNMREPQKRETAKGSSR